MVPTSTIAAFVRVLKDIQETLLVLEAAVSVSTFFSTKTDFTFILKLFSKNES